MPVTKVEFYKNSFGREDATIYVSDNAEPGELRDLALKLKAQGMTAYPDVRDGQQVLTAYGFKDHGKLTGYLKHQKLLGKVNKTAEDQEKGEKAGALKQFVQRFAIRLAAASGLLGHISMGIISTVTGDWKYFGTAWKYTTADAVIATYGTDKSVTGDPLMQDFKDYLWEQGLDNSFVKARTDNVSAAEGFNNFMKKRSFQIANAFGAMGNVNQIQIGLDDKDPGFVIAGATSLFGAGLQIFGSEKKQNPQQVARKGFLAKVFGFIDANPMQIAALTNFTDPFALFYKAFNSKKLDKKNLRDNNNKIQNELGKLSAAHLKVQGKLKGISKEQEAKIDRWVELSDKLDYEYGKGGLNFDWKKRKFKGKYSEENVAAWEKERDALKLEFAGTNGLDKDGNLIIPTGKYDKKKEKIADGAYNTLDGENHAQIANSIEEIENLQQKNAQIRAGQKGGLKRILLFAVAVFYTGATLLRLVAKKTATAKENKDAFNEVYASAAESLLNIKDEKQREAMMYQMGHFFSTHEKMSGVGSEQIIQQIRERVETFEKSPFVQIQTGDMNVPEPANDVEVAPEVGKTAEKKTETVTEADKATEKEAPVKLVKDEEPTAEAEAKADRPQEKETEAPSASANKTPKTKTSITDRVMPKKGDEGWSKGEASHDSREEQITSDREKADKQVTQPL